MQKESKHARCGCRVNGDGWWLRVEDVRSGLVRPAAIGRSEAQLPQPSPFSTRLFLTRRMESALSVHAASLIEHDMDRHQIPVHQSSHFPNTGFRSHVRRE